MANQRKPKAAAIYVRISQDRGGEALGVERQEQLCRDLAERLDWTVAELYRDNDLSAYSGKPRPAYRRMLDDLAAGTRDGVLVVDDDRLTRHPAELEEFITLADRHGIALANVSGDVDLSTSDGRFRARIMGAVARQESDKKSERLCRQREQAARRGAPHGGRRPYGFEPDGLTVRPAEAANVREAAARFLAGESLRTISRDWNERGIHSATGRGWTVTSLRTMLAGPRVAGLRVHRGDVVGEASWPALLDRQTWESVRAALGDPRRVKRGRPALNLLTGMLVCERCGCRLASSKRVDGSRRYVCTPTPGTGGCGRLSVQAEPVEAEIVAQVLAVLAASDLDAVPTADPSEVGVATDLEAQEAKLAALARDFAADRISRAEWLAAREVVDERIKALRSAMWRDERSRVLDSLPGDLDGLRALWEVQSDIEWRRAVLGAVVDHVLVKPAAVRGRRTFDPERVEVVWRI